MSPFLRVSNAAAWAGVSVSVIYRLIRTGQVEARCHGAKKGFRVVRASLEAWSASRGMTVAAPSLTPFERARQRVRSLKTENTDSLSCEPLQKGVG